MSVNNEKIAEIMQKSPTAEAFATYAACRERNARDGVTRLRAIKAQMAKEGFHPVPQDLLSMFRELERAGVGKIQGDVFKWSIPIRAVGEAINGAPVITQSPPKTRADKTLVIFFDKNRSVSVTFNPNMTTEEVSFLYNQLLKECR